MLAQMFSLRSKKRRFCFPYLRYEGFPSNMAEILLPVVFHLFSEV